MKIRISKHEWAEMGKKAGWLDTLRDALQPEMANPAVPRGSEDQDETGKWKIDHTQFTRYINKPPSEIDLNDLKEQVKHVSVTNMDFMMAANKAIKILESSPSSKAMDGLKIALYRSFYHGDMRQRKAYEDVVVKWYKSVSGISPT